MVKPFDNKEPRQTVYCLAKRVRKLWGAVIKKKNSKI
jgi:hypothetical protein